MTQLACLFMPGSLEAEKLTVMKVKASQALLHHVLHANLLENVAAIW